MRLAFDRAVLRAFLCPVAGVAESETIAEVVRASSVCVLPLVAEEIDVDGEDAERRWRDTGFEEVHGDEFFNGCATGMAQRYLDYYPDPRDCRLVAEAECAKVDLLITFNDDLINGLSDRIETITITTPLGAVNRAGTKDPPSDS